jgi:hypothetical protein
LAASASIANGSFAVNIYLAGSALAQAAAQAGLSSAILLAGSASAGAGTSASLTTHITLSGSAIAAAVASGALTAANTLNAAYLYAAQQAATPLFYVTSPPPQANIAVFTQSGAFTVPSYSNYFLVSATAAGGSPYGAAGRQTSRQQLPVAAGDALTISISPNVTVQRGGQTLLSLLDGAAYAKGTQGGLPQDSGIAGLGSGVDHGKPFPAALVFIWN